MQVQVSFEDRDHLRKKAIETHQEDAQTVLKYREVIDRASDDQMLGDSSTGEFNTGESDSGACVRGDQRRRDGEGDQFFASEL